MKTKEDTMMQFTIECDPVTVTSQQKGAKAIFNGLGQYKGLKFFKKAKVRSAEQELLHRFLPFRPKNPLKGPLELELIITFPWRESDSPKVRGMLRLPKDTKPDCDNLAKMVLDVMTQLKFWEDDAQISSLLISKQFGEHPGYSVFLWEM